MQTEPHDPVVATIGDIVVSQNWIVTPERTAPIGGTTWAVADLTRLKSRHPAWTVVLAILLFPIGLLFLLVKKTEKIGTLEVTVRGDGFYHAAQVVPRSHEGEMRIRRDVNRAQALAAFVG